MIRVLIVFCLVFASCQKSPEVPNRSIRINIATDPQTLDPRKARDLTTITLMRMFFEGLTRISREGDVELALADSVERSEDGLRYTFHLKESFWSNGEMLTADDFAASWKSLLDPSFPSDVAYQLFPIKNGRRAKLGEVALAQVGIETPHARTIVVELEEPIPYFLEVLSLSSYFPIPSKTAAANPEWALDPTTYVANGPFLPEIWKHSDLLHVKKNPRYWQADQVKLESMDLFMVSGDTEMRMFEEGKLDWAGSPLSTIPIDAVAALKNEKKLHVSPLSGTYFFRVNTALEIQGKKNPLSNSSFRKALAAAMDRNGIAEHILQGGQKAARSLVPLEMGLSEEGYFADGGKEQAAALLEEALKNLECRREELAPITLSYSSSERNAAIAQAVQKQWEGTLGVQVLLEAVEPKMYYKRLSQKEYQLAAGSWTADYNDPINFLEVFKYKDSGTNNTNWENPKYVELLNQSALCRDSEERKRILGQAEQILMDQMPLIPVFHFALNYLERDGVEGVALSPIGQIDFRWADVTADPSLSKR